MFISVLNKYVNNMFNQKSYYLVLGECLVNNFSVLFIVTIAYAGDVLISSEIQALYFRPGACFDWFLVSCAPLKNWNKLNKKAINFGLHLKYFTKNLYLNVNFLISIKVSYIIFEELRHK